MKLTNDQARDLILFIVGQVDYDIAKSLDPETAEEPEYTKRQMKKLIDDTQKYLYENDIGFL